VSDLDFRSDEVVLPGHEIRALAVAVLHLLDALRGFEGPEPQGASEARRIAERVRNGVPTKASASPGGHQ
jgi:hypothetical protein